MLQVAVIADDFTGAADTGVVFAKLGLRSVLTFGSWLWPDADMVAVSTDSRHRSRAEAIARTLDLVAASPVLTATPWIYKKIDSTLRGHPAAELRALLEGLSYTRALVAPAFPDQGRFTRHGRQWVWDTPLAETSFGPEVGSADLLELFAREVGQVSLLSLEAIRRGPVALGEEIRRSPAPVLIGDAETDADLAGLAQAAVAAGIRLFCGASGLAQALAGAVTWTAAAPFELLAPAEGRGVLVVTGSRHPQTLAQVAHCEAAGLPVIDLGREWLSDASWLRQVAASLVTGLQGLGGAVLTTRRLPALEGMQILVAQRLADTVAAVLAQHRPAGLVLTGGDVALACSQPSGAVAELLRGEVERGIPWGQLLGGRAPGMPIVTKAGGFGGPAALLRAAHFLECASIGSESVSSSRLT